jgi:hypothetical protein
MAALLILLGSTNNVDYTMDEVDTVRGWQDDLSDASVRAHGLQSIANGEYDIVIVRRATKWGTFEYSS